jgi:hypothetical protein
MPSMFCQGHLKSDVQHDDATRRASALYSDSNKPQMSRILAITTKTIHVH